MIERRGKDLNNKPSLDLRSYTNTLDLFLIYTHKNEFQWHLGCKRYSAGKFQHSPEQYYSLDP